MRTKQDLLNSGELHNIQATSPLNCAPVNEVSVSGCFGDRNCLGHILIVLQEAGGGPEH
jgi:hypothetical protein